MKRQEIARQVYLMIQKKTLKNSSKIWQMIAEMEDFKLITEYERLCDEFYERVKE